MEPDTQWHLDRRVPIGMIVTLLVQFVLGIWFISKLESRVYSLEVAQLAQKERDKLQDDQRDQTFNMLRADLREIARKLDRHYELEQSETWHKNGK